MKVSLNRCAAAVSIPCAGTRQRLIAFFLEAQVAICLQFVDGYCRAFTTLGQRLHTVSHSPRLVSTIGIVSVVGNVNKYTTFSRGIGNLHIRCFIRKVGRLTRPAARVAVGNNFLAAVFRGQGCCLGGFFPFGGVSNVLGHGFCNGRIPALEGIALPGGGAVECGRGGTGGQIAVNLVGKSYAVRAVGVCNGEGLRFFLLRLLRVFALGDFHHCGLRLRCVLREYGRGQKGADH